MNFFMYLPEPFLFQKSQNEMIDNAFEQAKNLKKVPIWKTLDHDRDMKNLGEFSELIENSEKPVFAYFGAPWCNNSQYVKA